MTRKVTLIEIKGKDRLTRRWVNDKLYLTVTKSCHKLSLSINKTITLTHNKSLFILIESHHWL